MCDLVHKVFLCAESGLTDKNLSKLLGVSESTINTWKIEHPEFLESLTYSKQELDDHVQESLYRRAKGCSHPETKVFCNTSSGEMFKETITKHYPPDTGAAFIWLKNRQSDKWADVRENVNYHKADEEVSDLEIARRVTDLLTNAVDPSLLN